MHKSKKRLPFPLSCEDSINLRIISTQRTERILDWLTQHSPVSTKVTIRVLISTSTLSNIVANKYAQHGTFEFRTAGPKSGFEWALSSVSSSAKN